MIATRFDKYIGEFSNGMFEGNGTYYFNDGSRLIIVLKTLLL